MFLGRDNELRQLNDLKSDGYARFIAIKGRRRIGKSRLIEEFSKGFSKKYLFTGLVPTAGSTSDSQREEFIQQMVRQGFSDIKGNDWSDIFFELSKSTKKGSVLIALDEIAWMGSRDPNFLGKLKIAWDQFFEKNPKLIIVVASSISSWIDKNILNSTGFFGRVDLTLTLDELPMKDCVKFWKDRESSVSAYEKLKVLGVTGGVPKYLEMINPKLSAEENIRKLCFMKSGLLFNEFDRIFHDLFSRRSKTYKNIVLALSNRHSLSQEEISKEIGIRSGQTFSNYLRDLTEAGFVSADYAWDIKNAKVSKLRKYRLADNYLRFYLKYIEPNSQKIQKGDFESASPHNLVQWDGIMGLQFENLVIRNRKELLKALHISLENCTCDGPFFQTKTALRLGCQIDYLVQEKNTLHVCEIKFSKNPVSTKVVDEVRKKIDALAVPKHVSCRPVLIHVGGVTDEVLYRDYFDKIIDWTELI